MIKQLIIGYPCQILFQSISDEIDKLKVYLEPFIEAAETEEEERECLTFVYLELSQIYLWYRHVQVSNDYLSKALHQAKIEVNLSARMGRRTKYQVRSKALLCVEVKRDTVQTPSEIRAERGFNARELAPKNVRLSDDTLLSKIIFEEEMPYLELTCEDEAVICGMVEHRIKSSCSSDVLNKEQASAYLDYLIERGKIWTVIYKSLFMRCLNERDSRRTLERAMTQLETLTDNIKVKSNYDCNLKMILFFSIMPDPIWIIEKAWADVLFSLGATKSALDVYDRLELWELTVSCLVR
jgi:PREDICTED: similar to tetratricopeptide repeat domain 27